MKAIKGVIKKVTKVIKKVTSSKIGRALLVGAAIFVGGGAIGAWKTGFVTDGMLGGAASGAGSGTAASAGANAAGGYAAAQPGTTLAGVAGSGPAGTATLAKTAAGGMAAPAADGVTAAAAPSAAPAGYATAQPGMLAGGASSVAAPAAAAKPGILARMMSGAGKMGSWAADHQMLTAMAITGIGGALSPDQMDLQQMQYDREDDERRRREGNLDVSNIDVGRVRDEPLTFTGSDQSVFSNGMLNNAARRGL